MKRLFLSFFLLAIGIVAGWSQEIKVLSMTHLEKDLSARVYSRQDMNGTVCALVRVQVPLDGAIFEGNIVGDVQFNVNEYLVYMTNGSKSLVVRHPKYHTLTIDFGDYGVASVASRSTYALVLQAEQLQERVVVFDTITVPGTPAVGVVVDPNPAYQMVNAQSADAALASQPKAERVPIQQRPFSFYLGGAYQLGTSSGIAASVGSYIGRFNVEGSILLGLDESEEIYLLDNDQSKLPYSYTYKTTGYGLKLGYAIPVGTSFRITPQVGAAIASVKGTEAQRGTGNDPQATDAYAVPLTAGVRLDYLFAGFMGVNVTPEFGFSMSESDLYARLSKVSSGVKAFGQGFNLRVGIFVCF